MINAHSQLFIRECERALPSWKVCRCVHTIPHGRMQHNTTLPYGKSCMACATKLFTSTFKKNFLPTIIQFAKTVEQEIRAHYMLHQKLHLHCSWWQVSAQQTFDDTDTLPTEFLCRHSATRWGIQKPCQSHTVLTSTLFLAFATQQSCITLHSTTWHNLKIPLLISAP